MSRGANKTIRALLFVTVSLGAIWAAFYTFHLFPLGEDLEWWNIPHMLTAASFVCCVVGWAGDFFIIDLDD